MLFNSYEFLFAFLPVSMIVYFLLNRMRLTMASSAWLLFASLFFYSWWNIAYLPLILGSILFNYTIGGLLIDYDSRKKMIVSKHSIMVFGLTANLLFLGYFKYMDFFIRNFDTIFQTDIPLVKIMLPLGISFFTITQIAFLVDSYEGLVEERKLLNYALFVTFFPHLLAGPILHHKEMMPQFERVRNKVLNYKNLYLGLVLFFMGLFKKVILADEFSMWVAAGFDSPAHLNFFEAWLASLSYTLQLYFDFSGYSDMAVGIGWMFNISLPVNFNSPYKAVSVIDFWKRWHMTLSHFITTYLYTPIVRSFNAITFRNSMIAIFIAMLISGFWHGAGWTYILWGGMHGLALVVNHNWRKTKIKMPRLLACFITFNFVNASLVVFRAKTLDDSFRVLKGMVGGNGVMLHQSLGRNAVTSKLGALGVTFGGWLDGIKGNDWTYIMVIIGLVIVFIFRNTNEIVASVKPNWKTFVLLVIVGFWSIMGMSRVSEFLYFQF
jgi:D-alanyl-lipoteichoic acid acyltransferase DltB (MBOAT superfamily)